MVDPADAAFLPGGVSRLCLELALGVRPASRRGEGAGEQLVAVRAAGAAQILLGVHLERRLPSFDREGPAALPESGPVRHFETLRQSRTQLLGVHARDLDPEPLVVLVGVPTVAGDDEQRITCHDVQLGVELAVPHVPGGRLGDQPLYRLLHALGAIGERLSVLSDVVSGIELSPPAGELICVLLVHGAECSADLSSVPVRRVLSARGGRTPGTTMESLREKRTRASAAASRAIDEKIAGLGAVRLRDAALARGINPDTLYEWARRGRGGSPFVGPRRILIVREAELDAELEKYRCEWDGCERFALLSNSGRCKQHDAALSRAGRLTAAEFAEQHAVNLPGLLSKLGAGEIPGIYVDRNGRPGGWLVDEQEVLEKIEDQFRCAWNGCNHIAFGRTGYCSKHAGAAAAKERGTHKVRKTCSRCGVEREDFPSQQRSGDLCGQCNLETMAIAQHALRRQEADRLRGTGVVLVRDLSEVAERPLSTLYRLIASDEIPAALPAVERPIPVPLVIATEDAQMFFSNLNQWRAWWGRQAGGIASIRGTQVGRPRSLSSKEANLILALARDGQTQRKIAEEVGVGRGQVYRFLKSLSRNPS